MKKSLTPLLDKGLTFKRNQESLLTSYQVADWLGIHFRSVHELRKSGELPAVAVAGCWRFDPQDVREFINDHKE